MVFAKIFAVQDSQLVQKIVTTALDRVYSACVTFCLSNVLCTQIATSSSEDNDSQGKHDEAERLYKPALAVDEKALGKEHPTVGMDVNNLAILYDTQKKHDEAEQLYKRALLIWEKSPGPDHPYVATNLESYATLLRTTNRGNEAAKLLARAKAIRAKYSSQRSAN